MERPIKNLIYFKKFIKITSQIDTWTLTADLERRISAMGMRCYRRLLGISYSQHVTNEEIQRRIPREIGGHEDLLSTVKERKLRWYDYVPRSLKKKNYTGPNL